MTAHLAQLGDLVIRLVTHSPHVFVIDSDRHHPQMSCKTYKEALRRAVLTAERSRVDVWYTDGHTYERVAQYRPHS